VRPTRNECEELISVGQETNTNNEYEESHDLQVATPNIPVLNLRSSVLCKYIDMGLGPEGCPQVYHFIA
jgi:hypothetical protein